VCLTAGEYNEQAADWDRCWYCPICGAEAWWDDEWHEDYFWTFEEE